jgi:hypothetical protein
VTPVRTPHDVARGTYANGVSVWFSHTEFTVDFLVSLPSEPATDSAGDPVMVVPQEVVARLKIPPPLVFELMRNLNSSMDKYEQRYGKIPEFGGVSLTKREPPSEG